MATSVQAFPHIFSPIKLGPIELPNRLLFGPHGKGYAEDGLPSDRHAAYYEERAKGGVALIITENENIHPTSVGGRSSGGSIMNYTDDVIPGYKRITEAVHRHGTKIICQITHHGIETRGSSISATTPTWGPSPVRPIGSPMSETPKEMELEDIQELIRAFRDAAMRAIKGGFDGVEVHFNFNGLLHHFLSPAINRRTDQYGGTLENRMRLLFEAVEAVRGAVGKNLVLGIRIGGDDLRPGGFGVEDAKVVCRAIASTGLIDYINTNIGRHDLVGFTVSPMALPVGHKVYVARAIKEAVKDLPVFTDGRFTAPEQIERVLAEGSADMVALVRALIADPEFVNKAKEARTADIRPCTGANSCIAQGRAGGNGVACIHNPSVGRERQWGLGTLARTGSPKRVLVAGGGPAGLEFALTAARRGHQVDLYEREAELGGQVNLAVRQPYRQDLGVVTGWRADQLSKAGIKVHLNTEVTPELVKRAKPDVVVVATGSRPDTSGFSPIAGHVDRLPGADQPNVFTAWEVLRGRSAPGKTGLGNRVVVLDDNFHHEGAGTIEYLLDQGKHVDVVTRFHWIGAGLEATLEEPLLRPRLKQKGVVVHPRCWARAIDGNSVRIYDVDTEAESVIDDVDSVVIVGGKFANDGLYKAIKGQVKELYRIGDCLAPRLIDNAIYEAHALARRI